MWEGLGDILMEDSLALKINIKRYPIYKMFAWDLLFYYAIIFLFLVKVKGFTASQIFFVDAFYPIFKFVFQIVCVRFSDLLGKRKCILIGNIFVCSAILLVLLTHNLPCLFIVNLLFAIGYNFKEICEAAFLNASIEDIEKKREIFSKVDGNASSKFYVLDAICALSSGFLYAINPYLPILLCLVFAIIGTCISYTFVDTSPTLQYKNRAEYFRKHLGHAYKKVLKSKRLRNLILFAALFSSTLAVFKTLMNSLFVDLKIPEVYFGFITAAIQIVSSFSSKHQNSFHKKFKNRALTFFALPLCIFMLISGLIIVFNISSILAFISVFIMVLFYAIVKGPYNTLIKRYFNSFVSSTIAVKIYSVNSMFDSLFRSITYFITSYILRTTTTAHAFIILGIFLTLIFVLLLDHMKTVVGLKPEAYPSSDTQIG